MENMEYKNILVVEDEKNISDVIQAYLLKEDFNVFLAYDGQEALDTFNKEDIHLIILDLMIPKISGEQVCKTIRAISEVPIIMLTAKTDEENRIQGLSIGADDYVLKPFSPRELVSRVKALLRRAYRDFKPLAEVLSFNNGDLEVLVEEMAVRKNGLDVELTNIEFKVLLSLVSNPNIVLSRNQLITAALGHEFDGYDRTIDSHIKNIRQKIENNPREPAYIQTVYGAGYKFSTN